ncbi:hypothetical protein [Streptomyces sp. A13(2022)]|uniref:hypothetical protein n=1 Tax=Streptomyces sp. A13(2022) TaxID=2964768 RepID=UPI0021DA6250|nr:hypothetical protein [Streptomyces sp. A13(2022)]MCU8593072.1 hypothetical protein [Streptomyces sp. A13(2022)]
MSPAPHATTTVRAARAGWLRVLVLLLALLVPCTPAKAQAAPAAAVTGAAAEYDHLDTIRPARVRGARRAAAARPAPGPRAGRRPGSAPVLAPLVPTRPPGCPRALRSVVLRC